jgi:hypothetical protein
LGFRRWHETDRLKSIANNCVGSSVLYCPSHFELVGYFSLAALVRWRQSLQTAIPRRILGTRRVLGGSRFLLLTGGLLKHPLTLQKCFIQF